MTFYRFGEFVLVLDGRRLMRRREELSLGARAFDLLSVLVANRHRVQTLESVCRQIGYLKTIRVDNGSKFISRDLDLWAYANAVTLDFSRPGKLTDNG